MSLSTLKAIRDGGITGGTTALVAWVLMQHGIGDQEALVIGAIVGGVAARLYRYARVRWPWLAELDPPAEANSLQ